MKTTEEENNRQERWKQATKALLGAVRKETCQPYSIPVVPDDLRKSNEAAYMPKVVSIGPRYKGKKELLPMEEIKWRCVTSLLSRTFGQNAIDKCMEAIIELDAAVRASYVDEIPLDRYALATTMLFDGCFLLELIICESKLDSEMPIPFNGISPGIEVKKMEYVITDLMLLENQIPIFILETLFEKLLGSSNQMREFIQDLALPLFSFSGKLMVKSTFHFLDIAYSYLEMGWMDKMIVENAVRPSLGAIDTKLQEQPQPHLNRSVTRLKASSITIRNLENDAETKLQEQPQPHLNRSVTRLKASSITIRNLENDAETKLQEQPQQLENDVNEVKLNLGVIDTKHQEQPQQHLNRCATRLKAAGITIRSLENEDDINFKLTTHFDESKGKLEIPRLIITQTTEVKWRSFIAWEHHKKKLKTSSSSVADRRSICTSSALLFRDLICCSSDVQLLKDRRVIVDQTNKSNRDLVAFFHSIASGVDRGIMDHKHTTMFHALNTFPAENYATKIFILLSHYFSKILDLCYGVYKFLKRGYNFAAAILSLLTVVQTYYAVVAYQFPPN